MSEDFLELNELGNKQVIEKSDRPPHVQLQYTPNKLKESILYFEAATMKKDEEKNSKLRELRAQNDLLQDRLAQARREKDGIEDSLNQQVTMYKKFLDQMEAKYELKVRDLQSQFHEQMTIYIREEQDKAKIVQSEKQKYESEIQLLRRKNQILESRLSQALKNIEGLRSERQILHTSQKQIGFEIEQMKRLKERQLGKQKQENQNLKKQIFEKQQNFKMQMHRTILEKEQEMENLKRQSLQDLSKLEQKAASQNELKNSEIQQITKTFNSQVERLNSQLKQRQNLIEQLKKDLSEQKQQMLETVRAFDKQINGLIHEKGRLASDVDSLKCANVKLAQREKMLALHPLGLNIEIDKLRDLLLQSSSELEKCKQELVFMDSQRNRLILQLARYSPDSAYLERSRRISSRRY